MIKQYYFKVYTPLESILVFTLALVLGVALIPILGPILHFEEWGEWAIKALLLTFILTTLGLMHKIVSSEVKITFDTEGIEIQYLPSFFKLKKENQFIEWTNLKEWSFQEGQNTGQSWSPSTFQLKRMNNKKVNLYVSDGIQNEAQFDAFFKAFQDKINEYNKANEYSHTIKKSPDWTQSKVAALVLTAIFISIALGMSWYFLYKQPIAEEDMMATYFSVVLIIGLSFVGSFFLIKKAFFDAKA